MDEYTQKFLVGIVVGIAVLALLQNAFWGVRDVIRQRRNQKDCPPAPTARLVLEVEEADNGMVYKLECGHRYLVTIPRMMYCPSCTEEIAALKKMAGEK